MKNILKSLFLVGVLAFTACEDPDGLDNWFDKPEADRDLTLTLPGEALELTEDTAADMLTFSWNAIDPPSEEYTINYVFKIGIVGDDYATCISSGDLGSEVTSYTLSKRQLNRFIVQVYGQNPNVEAQLQAKVLAYIDGGPFYYKPSLSEQIFTVKAYDISLQPLYLVGDANPVGNTAEDAVEITAVNKNYFYQKLNVVLKPNSSFVISLQNTSTYPAFMDAGDGEMVYVASEAEAANYKGFSTLDPYVDGALGTLNNYAVSVVYDDELDIPTGQCYVGRYCSLPVYIIGNAAEGWDMPGSLRQLEYDYTNPDCMVYNTKIKAGEFKLYGASGDWNSALSWRPTVANADPRVDHTVKSGYYSDDPKWVLAEDAPDGSHLEFKNHDLWINIVE